MRYGRMLRFILLLWFHFRVSGRRDLCPISRSFTTSVDGYLGYPMDVADADQMANYMLPGQTWNKSALFTDKESLSNVLKGMNDPQKELYMCTSAEERDDLPNSRIYHVCSSSTTCPVRGHSVHDAVHQMRHGLNKQQPGWAPFHNLCHIRSLISSASTEPVRFIVIGGSWTAGSGAIGCCCEKELDGSCPAMPNERKDDRWCGSGKGNVSIGCTWWSLLLRWMQALAPKANFQLFPILEGGCTSVCMGHSFDYRARGLQLTLPLTANDIVFVDLSVNDAKDFGFGLGGHFGGQNLKHALLEEGLESLIRKLLSGATKSLPTVILLEQYSNPVHKQQFLARRNTDVDYAVVYYKLAKQYKLLLYSTRDAAFSNSTDETAGAFAEYLQFHHQNKFSVGHPSWPVHLFSADLISALIRDEWGTCNMTAIPPLAFKKMPKAISNSSSSFHECSISTDQIVLQAFGESVYKNASIVGNFDAQGWQVKEDRPRKFGFIFEDPQIRTNALNFTFVNPWGWASIGNPRLPTIFEKRMRQYFTVNIKFMRTYENAGAFNVTLCGHALFSVDTLWNEHGKHVSTNEFVNRIWVDGLDTASTKWTGKGCNSTTASLVLTAVPTEGETPEQKSTRGTHKIKVEHVELCRFTNNEQASSNRRKPRY